MVIRALQKVDPAVLCFASLSSDSEIQFLINIQVFATLNYHVSIIFLKLCQNMSKAEYQFGKIHA